MESNSKEVVKKKKSEESVRVQNTKKPDETKPTQSKLDSIDPICPPALGHKGYKLGELIGTGQFANVYFATNSKKPNKVLACKRIDVESVPKFWKAKCMRLELKLLKKLSHPYIVKTVDLIKTRHTVFIFMDYCPNGSIFQKLQIKKCPFVELEAKIWFSQILGALCYCHSNGVAHRDIKLDNFLLDQENDAKLSDFGFATTGPHKNIDIMRDTSCGHPEYMAPEVFEQTKIWPYDAKAADMYSMGVCLFEMLNFDKPFDVKNTKNQLEHVLKQRNRQYKLHTAVEKTLSQPIKDLINQLLDPNPTTRITSEQTLIHTGLLLYPKDNQ